MSELKNTCNLFAELIHMIRDFPESQDPDTLDADFEDNLSERVQNFLDSSGIFNYAAQIRLPSDIYDSIIKWCEDLHNYYVVQILLCKLDMQLFPHIWENCEKKKVFHCLNDDVNCESTGILILPRVQGPQTIQKIIGEDGSPEGLGRPRLTATTWSDPLNAKLNNFFYVTKDALQGYELENTICEFLLDEAQLETVRIGITPLCSGPIRDTFSYDDNVDGTDASGNECKYSDFIQVKNPDEMNDAFAACYETANENGVGILIGPEMCGTFSMYDEDEQGYNPYFRHLNQMTHGAGTLNLILAPSYWNDQKNKANFYNRPGKKVGEQYKQHRYRFHGKHGDSMENLRNTPKKVCLIHIPGWGRLAVLICIDFLYPAYRKLMAEALQADFLLCPSFSPGSVNFEEALPSVREFGTYTVWINCCSARGTAPGTAPDYVGAVCTPTVSSQSPIVRLKPDCGGICREGCLFIVDIPLNCAGETIHEDKEVKWRHTWKNKEED